MLTVDDRVRSLHLCLSTWNVEVSVPVAAVPARLTTTPTLHHGRVTVFNGRSARDGPDYIGQLARHGQPE